MVELEFENVGFWEEGKTGVPGKKALGGEQRRELNQQQTQPKYDVDAGIWTRATLVGGERSHHCATPCSPIENSNKGFAKLFSWTAVFF